MRQPHVDRLLRALSDLAAQDELGALDAAWEQAIAGKGLERVSSARHHALQELGLRPARAEGWQSVSGQLFDLAYRPATAGRPWPRNAVEAASHALLGLVTRDLIGADAYRTLTAPLAERFLWLALSRRR